MCEVTGLTLFNGPRCLQLSVKGHPDDLMIRLHAAMLSVPEEPDRRGVCCGADSDCACERDGVECIYPCGCRADTTVCCNPLGMSRYNEEEVQQYRSSVLRSVTVGRR